MEGAVQRAHHPALIGFVEIRQGFQINSGAKGFSLSRQDQGPTDPSCPRR